MTKKAVLLLVGWAILFIVVLEMKLRVGIVLMPLLLLGFIVWFIGCTIKNFPKNNQETENKNENE
jgi:Na+-transporting methylmalonyl-CoA/oxaloacetate decarboxylase gamma subunit